MFRQMIRQTSLVNARASRIGVTKQTAHTIQKISYGIYYRNYSVSTSTSTNTSTTTTSKDTSKFLKASSFALPKENVPISTTNIQIPIEDIDDFKKTKLIHGNSNLEIAITKRASRKLNKIAQGDSNPNSVLKISVESGGCHGFQYNLKLTDIEEELKEAKQDEDIDEDEILIFKRLDEDGDIAQIMLDESSLEILQDSKLDYVKELIGSQFKIVDSPYTSTACGCGASFDFDFEKLEKKKQERKQSQ
ncbi:uncharacterized protein RJT21DRAFT_118097 [Scheffersomyces amazonensis]|uniref:uncharacterized protein n=1 Tax=Scheffersomyces amazonensis TaxID=1078765 RepID=UPI00315CF0CE